MFRLKHWRDTVAHRKHTLADFIQQKGLTCGAEIGVWQGATSSHILANTKCFLYLIDLWQPAPGYDGARWDHTKNKQIAMARIQKYKRYKILQGVSWQVAEQIQDQSLDFVFIDGDHSTQGVLKDIEAYTPKLVEGGYVMGHDWDWQSVKLAVHKHCADPQLLPNGIWYYKKGEHNVK